MIQLSTSYETPKSVEYVKAQYLEIDRARELMRYDANSLEIIAAKIQEKAARSKTNDLNIDDELDELQYLVHCFEKEQQDVNGAVANLTEE